MAKAPYPIPVSIRSEPIHAGPGGLEHGFYFVPFHIWDVILPIDELHHFSR